MLTTITKKMTSREIADFAERQHAHVMRDIREMEPAWERVNQSRFGLVEYVDAKGEKRPMYELTKTECLYVATKFNDEVRARLILRWEELEKQKAIDFSNPETVLQLAQNWADEQNKRIAAERTIKELAPKAQLMDKVLDSDRLIDIGQAAKILGLPYGRNTLFQLLRDNGIFFKNKNEPKQDYIDRGYFQLKEKFIERENHDGFVVIKVLVTQRGLEFLAKTFNALPISKTLIDIC
jgi:anti-repressor protein